MWRVRGGYVLFPKGGREACLFADALNWSSMPASSGNEPSTVCGKSLIKPSSPPVSRNTLSNPFSTNCLATSLPSRSSRVYKMMTLFSLFL